MGLEISDCCLFPERQIRHITNKKENSNVCKIPQTCLYLVIILICPYIVYRRSAYWSSLKWESKSLTGCHHFPSFCPRVCYKRALLALTEFSCGFGWHRMTQPPCVILFWRMEHEVQVGQEQSSSGEMAAMIAHSTESWEVVRVICEHCLALSWLEDT